MEDTVFTTLIPQKHEQELIKQLRDFLIRSDFNPISIGKIRSDQNFSKSDKEILGQWFAPHHTRILLENMEFQRRGGRWDYKIHSVESPLLLAQEVLFWLKEEYSQGMTLSCFDRRFLSRTFEIYQNLIDDRLLEENLEPEDLVGLRPSADAEFYDFIRDKLECKGLTQFEFHPDAIAILIGYFKEYDLVQALRHRP